MTWSGWLMMMAMMGMVIAGPCMLYLCVKLSAYGWYRGREVFFQSRARRQKWRQHDRSDRSENE